MVKRIVQEAKKRVNEEWTLSIAENFKENKKQLLEGRKRGQKRENLRVTSARQSMGEELTLENDTESRWRQYFV